MLDAYRAFTQAAQQTLQAAANVSRLTVQPRTWKEARSWKAHGALFKFGALFKLVFLTFSPSGLLLASGSSDETVKVWEVESGRLLHTLRHKRAVSSVAFSPDGQTLASGSRDGTVRLWGVAP